jgi:hypothetical protein
VAAEQALTLLVIQALLELQTLEAVGVVVMEVIPMVVKQVVQV